LGVFDGRSRASSGQSDDPFSDADVVLVIERTLSGFLASLPARQFFFNHGVGSGLWRASQEADRSAELSFLAGGLVFGLLSKPILNRDIVLIENPREQLVKLVRLDDLSIVFLPTELQSQPPAAESLFLAILAPDRLYDLREEIGRFRSPTDPLTLIRGPQALPPLTDLVPFGIASDPPLAVHTVGTRTLKG
jgi:hypothetical protein